MADTPEFTPGLAGVPCAKSSVCFIDGRLGKLQYRGYPIEQLAKQCCFEETAHLLLFGKLPNADMLVAFTAELAEARSVPEGVLAMLGHLPKDGHAMDALTTGVAALGMYQKGDHVSDPIVRRQSVVRLIAVLPTLVAAWDRIRLGKDPIAPRQDLNHAANFMYMLRGEEADPLTVELIDVALTLHAEHSMNASTFTGRVTASTLADPYAAVTSAIGSLSGRLHGGANERVLATLRSIPDTTEDGVRAWATARLAKKEKIMGFGHRVYKVKDPRAAILQGLAKRVFAEFGSSTLFDVAVKLEGVMEELVGKKGIYPNVDFYSGIVYEKINIPEEIFTPLFGIARVSGWLAHLLEQLENNRIFRPSQIWTGESDRTVPALAER